ncbi:MAG: hypothetical protein E7329_10855 [Clostridiales bacterium]|nr:hypothetical protein [Clostridiales bacterium]
MGNILIKNGRIWNGSSFLWGDVLIAGNIIAKIAPAISGAAAFIFDAKGKTVLPGLVDAHVHMRGISPRCWGTPAESSCFPFGVTAAADAAGIYGSKAHLDSFLLKTAVFVPVRFKQNQVDFTETEKMLNAYGDRAVGIKVYFDAPLSGVSTTAPLKLACAFARKKGLRTLVHCAHSPAPMKEILNILDAGDILTHAFHGGENHAALDGYESIKAAQKRGVIIDIGFAGHVHTDFQILREAIERGVVPDLISSDVTGHSAFTRGGRYGLTLCMSIARHLGMKEEDIFRAVTSNPARALGKENEWGALREGGCADIAVLDYTRESFDLTDQSGHRVHSPSGYRCLLTVGDGQIVYKD